MTRVDTCITKAVFEKTTWMTPFMSGGQFEQMIIDSLKGNAAYLKKNILWTKMIHYPNTLGSHLVTIVSMAPFTPISTSKLRSALHIRYSIVIRRFISRANLINIMTTVFLTLLTTTTMFIVTISCAQCLLMLILYVIQYL